MALLLLENKSTLTECAFALPLLPRACRLLNPAPLWEVLARGRSHAGPYRCCLMRPPERQQSLGLLLFLADRLNPARLGVRALLTLACAAGSCFLKSLSVRDRYLLQHFVAMGVWYTG